MTSPSPKGANGARDLATGRFLPGHGGGPGNPYARRTAEIRSVMMSAVSDDDLHAIVRTLVKLGKAGDVMAAREIFDRMLGKSVAHVITEQHDERTMLELQQRFAVLVQSHPEVVATVSAIPAVRAAIAALPPIVETVPGAAAGDDGAQVES